MATEFGGIADDVVPAKNVEGKIGWYACTTAEEDLILADLVLEQCLKKGYRSSIGCKRRVTPGSLPIIAILNWNTQMFLLYCVAADKANEGAIGNLASTATVAASSFEMKIKDPRELIDLIDPEKYKEFLEQWLDQGALFVISKPNLTLADPNYSSSLSSDLPLPPPSFEDNVVTDGGCIV
ncbi:hypothetical protein Glove_29g73 [Diversispora epigaea]|uniref:Uncharacterized protein n=1 Tax=Diversispora epigaea TaxID=1348612 RepID=A0A397JIS6_9GLOM|nr:hypothetical protein Glove_29g73 [Diversispora epigaea]